MLKHYRVNIKKILFNRATTSKKVTLIFLLFEKQERLHSSYLDLSFFFPNMSSVSFRITNKKSETFFCCSSAAIKKT